MDQKYFRIPFALSGDKTTIPDAIDPSGVVSFDAGYGFDYERDRATDPAAKAIERAKMNYLFGAITEALAALQQSGAPEWITSADNGGTAFPYSAGAIVKYRPSPSDPWATYVSLTNNNTQTPGGSQWRNVATLAPLASPAFSGTPTVPTAAPGTNTTQAASTAFVQAAIALIPLPGASSLTANGYQVFAGGLIVQWGSSLTSGANVAFPIAFPNALFSIQATIWDNFGPSQGLKITSKSLSGHTMTSYNTSGSAVSVPYSWVAIGY